MISSGVARMGLRCIAASRPFRPALYAAVLACCMAGFARGAGEVLVNELMARNDTILVDGDGDYSDWIELYNPTTNGFDLTGCYLTDDTEDLRKWQFPATNLAAGEFLVVFASGKDRAEPGSELHTSFGLDGDGEYLGLVDSDGMSIIHHYAPEYPEQLTDVSYGIGGGIGYFTVPTPGATNGPIELQPSAPVTFSVGARAFIDPFSVTLATTNTPGTVIRYTTDGSVPTAASTAYASPIAASATVLIRARAFEPGLAAGPVAENGYVKLAADVQGFSSDLPVVIVETFGGGDIPSTSQEASYMTIHEQSAGRTALTNLPTVGARTGIRRRGESSLRSTGSSPNLAVEAWNADDDDTDIAPLGMPAESDWVLYAPYHFDRVYLNNPFMFELSNLVGIYATRTRWCEVFLHTSGGDLSYASYAGIYAFTERIKRGDERVDVERMTPLDSTEPNVTGGYMWKIDKADPGKQSFSAGGQGSMYHVYPRDENITTAQRNWLIGHLNEFGAALNGPNFRDDDVGYARYIRVPPAIDHHILNVLSKNADALRLSTYLYKPRGERFTWGPIWDFDRALESSDGRDNAPTGWTGGTAYFTYGWWNRLFRDPDFCQQWIDRWQELRGGLLSTTNMFAIIDDMADELAEAQVRNYAVRPGPRFGSWQAEIDHLKDWLQQRATWMDGQFIALPQLSHPGGEVQPGFSLAISGPPGSTLYYTTNGVDPRAEGGGASSDAVAYTGPITLDQSATVRARATDGSAWSSWPDAPWSGQAVGHYVIGNPSLAITELMYNPRAPSAAEAAAGFEASDFEFAEIKSTGGGTMLLNGVRFDSGISFNFSGGDVSSLAPGEYAVVVKDFDAFTNRYPGWAAMNIAGEYGGKLGNGGERVRLRVPGGDEYADFTYDDSRGWPLIADGAGHTLVPLALGNQREGALDYGGNWRASAYIDGSPGFADPPAPTTVLLNEILAHTDVNNPPYDSNDGIELHNVTGSAVSLTNWYLSDDMGDLRKWGIPGSNAMAAGGWIWFDEMTGFHNPITNGFGLDKSGEQVFLSHLPGTAADRVADWVRFKGQENGVSLGRYTDGGAYWYALSPTTNAANAVPGGHLVISEIMYHPRPTVTHPEDNSNDEYVEIHNPTASRVDLWTVAGTYRMDGGIGFSFPAGTQLDAGEFLVLVPFNPQTDIANRDAFLAAYHLTNGQVRILGPYSGRLSNRGERVALERPQPSDDPLDPTDISWVIVDEVIYLDQSPWPAGADATGLPIQRRANAGAGRDPSRWFTGFAPTPGLAPGPVGITRPADGDSFVLPVAITVEASVDNDYVSGTVHQVEFFLGTSSLGTDATPPYQVPLDSITVTGAYVLAAVMTDDAGAHTSRHVNITVERLTVNNTGASNVTSFAASVGGTLTDGTSAETYIYWGTGDGGTSPGNWDHVVAMGTQSEGTPFSTTITDLSPGHTYYYRCYVTNASGEQWATASTNFTTLNSVLTGWTYRMPITFSGYSRPSALSNFPALVVLNEGIGGFLYSDFADPAGGDLRFTDGMDTTELSYEIDTWDTTGNSYVWVRVPRLAGADTMVWAYWGNTSAGSPMYSTNGSTWDSDFVGVWHMSREAPGTGTADLYGDSTAHGHHGNDQVSASAQGGVIGPGQELDGGDDYVDVADVPELRLTGQLTLETWVKPDVASGTSVAISKKSGWNASAGYDLELKLSDGNVTVLGGGGDYLRANTTWDTQWHHVAATIDGTTGQIYRDGNTLVLNDSTIGALTSGTDALTIGRRSGGGAHVDGRLDEVRVSRVARSADWLWATWKCAAEPASFAAFGTVTLMESDTPVVANTPASSITIDSATLNGMLHSTGTAATAVFMYWGDSDGGATPSAWAHTNDFGLRTTGSLAANVTGLLPGRRYYYRFRATNAHGENWANVSETFRAIGPPFIANAEADNITPVAADLYGDLTSTGGAATTVHVYWDTSDGGTDKTAWAESTSLGVQSPGPVGASVSGLTPGQLTYYRFYATNAYGDGWAATPATFTPPAEYIWDGGGGDNKWSTGANWDNDVAPANGGGAKITLAGTTRLAPRVDAAWNVQSLTFAAGAGPFVLSGSNLTVAGGGILNQDTDSPQTISNDITVAEAQLWKTTRSGSPLTLAGDISGNATVTYDLAADRGLRLAGSNNAFVGTLQRLDDDRGPLLVRAAAMTGGNIPLNGNNRNLFLNGAGNPGTYTFGIGGGTGEVRFRGGGSGGLSAVGGTVRWDPGAGSHYAFDTDPVDFHMTDGGDSHFLFGNAGSYLRLTGGRRRVYVKAGVTSVLFGLGDDGSAREFEVNGAGLLILTHDVEPGANPGSWTDLNGHLGISSMGQLFDGALRIGGTLYINGIPWSAFSTDRSGGYGSGNNQWQLDSGNAGFAAVGSDFVIDGGNWARNFTLGSFLTTNGHQYADKSVVIATDIALADSEYLWRFRGRNREADYGWILDGAVSEISGRITGGGADCELNFLGYGDRETVGGGSVRLSNTNNSFVGEVRISSHDGSYNGNPPAGTRIRNGTAGIGVIVTGDGALGHPANGVYVGTSDNDAFNDGLLLFENRGTGTSVFSRAFSVLNSPVEGTANRDRAGDSGFGSYAGTVLYNGTVTLQGTNNHTTAQAMPVQVHAGALILDGATFHNNRGHTTRYHKTGAGTLRLGSVAFTGRDHRWRLYGGTLATSTNGQLRSSGDVDWDDLFDRSSSPRVWEVTTRNQVVASMDAGEFQDNAAIRVAEGVTLTTTLDANDELHPAANDVVLKKQGAGTWIYTASANIDGEGGDGYLEVEEGILDATGNMGDTRFRLAGGTILSGRSSSFAGDTGTGTADENPCYIASAGGKLGISPSAGGDVHRGSTISSWNQSATSTVTLAARDNHDLIFDNTSFQDIGAQTTLRIERDGAGTGLVRIDDTSMTLEGTLAGSGTVQFGNAGQGTLTVNGRVSPGGQCQTLSITGHVVMAAGAVLDVELGSTNESDVIVVGGDLTLDGSVDVTDIGTVPGGTNTWTIIRYAGTLTDRGLDVGTISGAFAAYLDATSTPHEVRLTVTEFPDSPVIHNAGVVDIAATAARCQGELLSTGAAQTVVFLHWGETDAGTNASAWAHTETLGLAAPGLIGTNITSLSADTTYFCRFHATNAFGHGWALETASFKTTGQPTVGNSGGATGVGVGKATLNALLGTEGAGIRIYWGPEDGGSNAPAWRHCVSLGSHPPGATASTDVSGLFYGLRYHYRAYATNSAGDAWAPESTNFLTASPLGGLDVTDGLRLWLDADDAGTLWKDTGGSVPVTAAGDLVARWDDRSGNGFDVTQATASRQPAYRPAVVKMNSRGALYFDADVLGRANDVGISGNADRTLFTVWANAVNHGANYQHTFHHGQNGSGMAYGHSVYRGGNGRVGNHYWSGGFDTTVAGSAQPAIAASTWDGDGGTGANGRDSWWVNGTSAGYLDRPALNTGAAQLLLGSRVQPQTEGIRGDVAEVLLYDRVLSSEELETVGGYLSTKYGIAGGYPANDHAATVITNTSAANITHASARLRGTLDATGSVFSVYAFWGDTDGTTNVSSWARSAFVGSFTNAIDRTVFVAVGGLLGNTTYSYTLFASNAAHTCWAAPSHVFQTAVSTQPATMFIIR